ncbi:hypothetical protein SAMN02745134_03948 [Clostridium acidisoli DSM 12555]|uniref:HTH cro/C1-type domain-containing protein n=1 Tax=Clostridium acidisoli DSM 12555 TaxID=1121291 RepID=A0A1W1Y040_9CLOT|nr:helix-turn-helix transcriptional regulator [Clostridium acidisoli]SMC29589.1 hypothetical protein SAMN02745134_03948 [Clostridium acidisoli DSM 12555]
MPETTIADKIIKLRYTHNLRQEDLADLLNMHCSAIDGWEVHNVMPKPISIDKLCKLFNLPYNYFHEYYKIYFNNPGEKIKSWKIKNKLTYEKLSKLLGITHSCVGRLLNNKINLSYNIYMELKKLGAF